MIELKSMKDINELNSTIMNQIYYQAYNIVEDLTRKAFDFCGFSEKYVMEHPEEFSIKYDIDKTIYYHLDKMLFYIEDSLSNDGMSIRWEVKFV